VALTVSLDHSESEQGILHVLINGNYWKTISIKLFGKKPRFPIAMDLIELQANFAAKEKSLARSLLARRIAKKALLYVEAEALFKELYVSQNICQEILSEFSQCGYIDDSSSIHRFIEKEQKKGIGKRAIVYKLRKRGIADREIEKHFSQFKSPDSSMAAYQFLIKKYSRSDFEEPKQRLKAFQALLRRGFDTKEAKEAIEKMCVLEWNS
jgi:SOS response regulatory protein OraA/RecX